MNSRLLLTAICAAMVLAQGCVAPAGSRGSRSAANRNAPAPYRADPYATQPVEPVQDPFPPATVAVHPVAVASDDYAKAMSVIEDLDVRVETLREDLRKANLAAGQVSREDLRLLQDRLNRIEQQLVDQQAARAREQDALLLKVSDQVNKSMREYLSGNPPPTRAATSSPAAAPARGKTPPVERGWEHVVEAGQTLSAIAVAYGTTTQSILKANNLQNADSIRVGQKLFVPAPSP
jgi:LysM repeat protein